MPAGQKIRRSIKPIFAFIQHIMYHIFLYVINKIVQVIYNALDFFREFR